MRVPSLVALGLAAVSGLTLAWGADAPRWTDTERDILRSMSLAALPEVPPDPSNRVADDPRAVALGEALFADTRFSADGTVSCASCHLPERQFQDDLPLAHGIGTTGRRTMPLAGVAQQPFLFWDGRKDSLWAQALGPWESAVEHGGDRTAYAHVAAANYRAAYEALFGPMPDLSALPDKAGPVPDPQAAAAWVAMSDADRDAVTGIFVNLGKAIAAYERTLTPPPTRFDAYVAALDGQGDATLSEDEIAGLRLFIGKANCATCHTGPMFSDGQFHNTGIPAAPGLPEDFGRSAGIAQVRADPFNCLGRWSDAAPDDCVELTFLGDADDETLRAFKTPSLRGAASRPPYMHAGQIADLAGVLDHYSTAPPAPAGHSELVPLNLSARERAQIAAFLKALDP